MDAVFRGELGKFLRLEVVQVSRTEMLGLCNAEQISSTEAISPEFLRMVRDKYAADAILFTEFTVFRPYRPIVIGVRSKLVEVPSMRLLWMSEGVVDSADPVVAMAASKYSQSSMRVRVMTPKAPKKVDKPKEGSSGSNQIVLQSPRMFGGFVAHQMYSTLPPQK